MLRLNREKNTPHTNAKRECANYHLGLCSGVMIGKRLQQVIDGKIENKPCLIKQGEKCEYYEYYVKKNNT